MQRRFFLKLGGLTFLPLLGAPAVAQAQPIEPTSISYTDSEHTDPILLRVLCDTALRDGGITYQA